jgi:hypothetical protein
LLPLRLIRFNLAGHKFSILKATQLVDVLSYRWDAIFRHLFLQVMRVKSQRAPANSLQVIVSFIVGRDALLVGVPGIAVSFNVYFATDAVNGKIEKVSFPLNFHHLLTLGTDLQSLKLPAGLLAGFHPI